MSTTAPSLADGTATRSVAFRPDQVTGEQLATGKGHTSARDKSPGSQSDTQLHGRLRLREYEFIPKSKTGLSHKEQLAIVQSILDRLGELEEQCISIWNEYMIALPSPAQQDQRTPANDTDVRGQLACRIVTFESLIIQHLQFLAESQRGGATEEIKEYASKYHMPARLWMHGIHQCLEILVHHSLCDIALGFIADVMPIMRSLYREVDLAKASWAEGCGDLCQYQITTESPEDSEGFRKKAIQWYLVAFNLNPTARSVYSNLIKLETSPLLRLSLTLQALSVPTPCAEAQSFVENWDNIPHDDDHPIPKLCHCLFLASRSPDYLAKKGYEGKYAVPYEWLSSTDKILSSVARSSAAQQAPGELQPRFLSITCRIIFSDFDPDDIRSSQFLYCILVMMHYLASTELLGHFDKWDFRQDLIARIINHLPEKYKATKGDVLSGNWNEGFPEGSPPLPEDLALRLLPWAAEAVQEIAPDKAENVDHGTEGSAEHGFAGSTEIRTGRILRRLGDKELHEQIGNAPCIRQGDDNCNDEEDQIIMTDNADTSSEDVSAMGNEDDDVTGTVNVQRYSEHNVVWSVMGEDAAAIAHHQRGPADQDGG
ncbi:hypothetical protein NKR23_g12094 [Pleurostoma richardsiae]|uniref:Uncharacterized protein n=1 Tax=Pleurostoma richardsiae TaxID=41990 RepID=A0AA38RHC4_9PEZI|nr:hypothetical protein NKR23_g12094 [Pleurostoma richardsiae]